MRRSLMSLGFLLVGLFLFLTLTTPKDLPAFLLTAPFLVIFVALYRAVFLLFRSRMSSKQVYKVASLGAGVPVVILILQSIGQLTFRDVLVIVALIVVGYFYIVRSKVFSS